MEDARAANRRADAVEAQVGAAVEQLEKAHIELHRRSEALRQKTRTLYLIDRVLTLDAHDGRSARDGERAAHPRRRRHGGAALLAAAPRPRGAGTLSRRGARHRPERADRASRCSSAKVWPARWRQRASHCSCRTSPRRSTPAASRRVVHDGIVHQLPARLSRHARGRGQPQRTARCRASSSTRTSSACGCSRSSSSLVATQARLPERMLETLSVG